MENEQEGVEIDHTGQGPKNYRPSEDGLYEEVCRRLSRHSQIDARGIEVYVRDGEVTLLGEVDNERARLLAVNIADGVPGVRKVHNRLRVLGLEGRRKWAEAGAEAEQQQQGIDWRPRLHRGMPVIGTDGEEVGEVKAVRDQDFLIARRFKRDIYLSLLYIENIKNGTVMLNLPADKVSRSLEEHHPADRSSAAGQEETLKPGE